MEPGLSFLGASGFLVNQGSEIAPQEALRTRTKELLINMTPNSVLLW